VKVLVTGGTGFLGKFVMDVLKERGLEGVAVGTKDGDLTSHVIALRVFQQQRPDMVIHLAAQVGGIGANLTKAGMFWQTNTMMGVNVLDAALATGVKRVLVVGTTCSYPRVPKTIPFIEDELFEGYPEGSNAPYGMAKRNIMIGALAYRKQFGLDCVFAVPTNLYGPGDNFDPKDSHVIPALMRKMYAAVVAKQRTVQIWGTGRPTRDFLYVTDAAHGIVTVLQKGESGEAYNLGSGHEHSISDIAQRIAAVTGFKGHAHYDSSQPDGQPRRCLDITRAKSIGWKPEIRMQDGLDATFAWWKGRG
jgi:GDP-L-fucose synthase